ncbi:EAL domain-containing protein [Acinetobacter cumulans]|uniref:EAL domain-containing protein n=1 Tax=Acinetobacter cumulans TaxID=2136182 RepID=A0A3A8G5N8_9GAMM|nr:EAL domain-containing protein [Acinetobacter cumulans]RKG45423.1 EAL domain-containing protein [Acinetobacter cumulans]RKG53256.1 EAL domain-containing protein [Acinetobacter cumulans]RZG60276.1 EAL domain-containing protein [Acinetobacter sp. WCHAc060006]
MKSSSKNKPAVPHAQYDTELRTTLNKAQPNVADDVMLQQFANNIPLPLWLQTAQGPAFSNSKLCQFIDVDLNQHLPEKWLNYIHPEDFEHFIVLWQKAQQTKQNFKKECRLKHHQLGYRMCAVHIEFPQAPNSLFECSVSFIDIHDSYEKQQALSHQVSAQNKMLNASIDCIKILAPDGNLTHMNRSGCLALGVSVTEKKFGMPWLNLLPEDIRKAGSAALAQACQGKNTRFAGKSTLDGQTHQFWDNILTPIVDENGVTESILCVSRDVTQQKAAESRLQQIIEHDELTGLFNRRAFTRIFKKHLQYALNYDHQIGLMLIDLDYFKHVNDTLGHVAGDHLLHTLGQRFKSCFSEDIIVSRLGGDEFAILVPELVDEQQLMDVAHQAWLQLDMPISYTGQFINGGMSIGCSIYPRDAQSSSNLMKCADIALNDLKISGRGGIRMFNLDMFKALEATTRQLTLARSIIKNDQIEPFYQPKVQLQDSRVIGFEALLRWKDQHGVLQLPSHIYAAFQDYDLASRISETMQNKIFQDMNEWQDQGLELLPISINAAPVEFLRDDYAEKMLQRLQKYKIPHDKVEVEITEQSLSERGSHYVIRALHLLKKEGLSISLDDFGTGHSSLTRLSDYPIDCIKIDRNFVERMTKDSSALAIVKAITQLGSSISMDILVEGIENTEQLNVLKDCECQKGQGFYFYRPMSFEHISALLEVR